MGDTSVKKVDSQFSPKGQMGQKYLAGGIRAGVYPHISVHCVANVPPNPGRYRMLVATGPSRRRLFRDGVALTRRRRLDDIPRTARGAG